MGSKDSGADGGKNGQRGSAKHLGRRRFLRALGLATPAAAASLVGALGVRSALAKGGDGSPLTPGETERLRRAFLKEARSAAAPEAGLADGEATRAAVATLTAPGTAMSPRSLGTDVIGEPAPNPAPIVSLRHERPLENILTRMQDDLRRALDKPIEERRWSMVIDLRKCIGCSACTIACKAENHLPPGVVYRPVLDEELGEYPRVARRFTPRPCMQCDEPPCVPVCPVGATYKRPDGIVEINYNRCIGCRYCITACPYSARTFDFGSNYTDDTPERQAYEETPAPEYGHSWDRGGVEGVTRKCQFCLHRLDASMLPACVTTCVGGATFFGDKNDPDSLVSELIGNLNAMRLKEEQGTEPKVWYLV